jgi:hypothetical protein
MLLSALTLRLQLGAVLLPVLALQALVTQLRVVCNQRDLQELMGPKPGLERAVEMASTSSRL